MLWSKVKIRETKASQSILQVKLVWRYRKDIGRSLGSQMLWLNVDVPLKHYALTGGAFGSGWIVDVSYGLLHSWLYSWGWGWEVKPVGRGGLLWAWLEWYVPLLLSRWLPACHAPLPCCPILGPVNYGLKHLHTVNQNKPLVTELFQDLAQNRCWMSRFSLGTWLRPRPTSSTL